MTFLSPRCVRFAAALFVLALAAPAVAQSTVYAGRWGESWMQPGEGWPVEIAINTAVTPRVMTVTFKPGPYHQMVCNTEIAPADSGGTPLVVTLNGTKSGTGTGAVWTFSVVSESTPTFGNGSLLTSTTAGDGTGTLAGTHGVGCELEITSGSITDPEAPHAGDTIAFNFNFVYPVEPPFEPFPIECFLSATYGALPVELESFSVK
jgi:hypothetical protein